MHLCRALPGQSIIRLCKLMREFHAKTGIHLKPLPAAPVYARPHLAGHHAGLRRHR